MPTTSNMTTAGNRAVRLIQGAAVGSALVVLVSYCAFRLHFNLSAAGSLDLLIVVSIALKSGFWEATGSSIVAFACLDYFFAPPIWSLRVADPDNWVALAVFELTALLVSRLSDQVQNQTRQARVQRSNATRLYELSRSILVLNRQQPPGSQIATLIKRNIGADAVAIFDSASAGLHIAGTCTKEEEKSARSVYFNDTARDDLQACRWHRVLRVGRKPIGSLVIRGGTVTSLMVDAVASLVAAAFERSQSFEKETRAEATRQSEQLRATIVDGLAHAFKTPLTVILTSTSGLLEMRQLSPSQADLVELIDQHASRLNALTSHLLRMAKLESAEIRLRPEDVAVRQLVDEIVDECSGQLVGHSVHVRIADAGLAVFADRQLLNMMIREFIINAAKYACCRSPITISSQQQAEQIVISVHNEGPVIDVGEQERIFDRFYRSPATKYQAPGSGIGLSVAKKTAEAHGGKVWVNSSLESGTTFFLSLPAAPRRAYESVAG